MPPRKIDFHPAALEEAEAARDWYAERSPAVAGACIRELFHAVEHVAAAPERWPRFSRDTRGYLFPKFLFSLIYRAGPKSILIVAVAHTKRRPGYWQNR
ncbi:MAG: type II toxin-antitoxin system RelE/ParE family toxin [Desulfobaccales bacterium]